MDGEEGKTESGGQRDEEKYFLKDHQKKSERGE